MIPFRISAAAAVLAFAWQQTPSFRSGVDLLTVEATVLDRAGVPVRDLGAGDFIVTIDGKPRKVVFADFHGGRTAASPAGNAAAPAPAATSSDPTRPDAAIVIFAVDRDSLASGNERALLDTATGLLDTLQPGDAAGLLGIPVGSIELTRDHARVRKALPMMTGTRPRQVLHRDRDISWEEALAYERGDNRVIAEVIERECYNIPERNDGLRNPCPPDLVNQAREMLQTGRAHVQTLMSTMDSLLDNLAPLRGSKHVIFMSGGLPFGQDLLPYFNAFAKKAALAQVAFYVVHLDQPDSDASDRIRVTSALGGRNMTQGLGAMASMTGGGFFSAVGKAEGVFDRINTEINNFYVLGVESAPDDKAGATRGLKIAVSRADVTVRARTEIAPQPAAAALPADRLKTLLNQPTDLHQLPIGVSTYSTRGTDDSTLRVLISSEVTDDRSRLPIDWGYVVLNDGNVVSTGQQRFEAATPGPLIGTISAKLVPGQYRLRVAATDVAGRSGVTDLPLAVGLRVAGEIQMSDLIVGVADAGKLQPRARITQGTSLSALIELMSADAARLQSTRAIIEVIPAGAPDPIKRFLMAARTGASDAILVNAAEIDTTAFPPGHYTASVVVLVNNEPVGRVSQVFEVVRQL